MPFLWGRHQDPGSTAPPGLPVHGQGAHQQGRHCFLSSQNPGSPVGLQLLKVSSTEKKTTYVYSRGQTAPTLPLAEDSAPQPRPAFPGVPREPKRARQARSFEEHGMQPSAYLDTADPGARPASYFRRRTQNMTREVQMQVKIIFPDFLL